jgi:hypothetical protein
LSVIAFRDISGGVLDASVNGLSFLSRERCAMAARYLKDSVSQLSTLTFLACLQVASFAATGNAAIRFELPEVSVIVSGSQSAVGNIDVVVRADASDLPKSVSSFNLDFQTSSSSLSLSPAQGAPNPLFAGDVLNFSPNSQTILAGEDVFPSSSSLFDGAGLVRVPFQVPVNVAGVFPIQFGLLNELTNANALPLTIQTTDTGSVTVITAIAGDYNHNGKVDAPDYVVWRKTLGSTTDRAADGDQSFAVDSNDYGVWKANYGSVGSYGFGASNFGASNVPEPSSMMLLLTFAAVTAALARRKPRIDCPNT